MLALLVAIFLALLHLIAWVDMILGGWLAFANGMALVCDDVDVPTGTEALLNSVIVAESGGGKDDEGSQYARIIQGAHALLPPAPGLELEPRA